MGEKIKTAIEIAMEKAAKIGDLTPEEKEKIKDKKKIAPIMTEFYKGKIGPDELWQKLKGEKPYILKEAQTNLVDSIIVGISPSELQRRKKGILAIESLKKDQNTAAVEQHLNIIEDLQGRAVEEKEQVYNNLKLHIENNPQAKVKKIKQGDTTMIIQLSTDEAINQNPEWKKFILEHEKKYGKEISRVIESLKTQLK